jgi:hypothetical protein
MGGEKKDEWGIRTHGSVANYDMRLAIHCLQL